MADMIKFFKGLEASLPTTGVNGALYITTDEGAIYLGTGTGMKRLGDFVQVTNVASLPAKAHESCLYYCVAENILAKWNGTEWKQINKQPTAEELKTLLGLGSMAYTSEVGEDNLSAALKEKVNAASEGNHAHSNKALLDTYTQTEADLADAVAKKHAHTFVEAELNKIADGDVAKWNAAEGNAKAYVDEKIGALDYTDTAVDGEYVSSVSEVDGKISVTRKALPDYTNVYEAKGEAAKVQGELNTYKEANDIALANVKATAEAAYVKPVTGIAKTDLSAEVQTSLGKADTALQSHQDISHLAVKSEVETELGKKVDKTTYEGKVSELETAIGGKVAKTDYEADKATFATKTDISKLASVSEGANKVEASTTNGSIKIDGVETVVYTHPEKHAIADVTGLQDALDGKQAAGNYSVEGHKHVKADITDFAHTHVASEITDLDTTIKGYNYATKTEAEGYANAKDEAIAAAKKAGDDAQDAVEALAGKVGEVSEGQTVMGIIKNIQENAYDDTELTGRVTALETESAKHAIKTEVEAQFANYTTTTAQQAIDAEQDRRLGVIEGDYLKAADIANFETKANVKKVADDLAAYVESNDAAVALKANQSDFAELKTTVDNFFAEDAAINDTIDTLKEIANYIANDKEGAADITARVGALEGKVDVEKVSTAIAAATTDMATNAGVDAKLADYTKTTELGALASKDVVSDTDLDTDLQAKVEFVAGVQGIITIDPENSYNNMISMGGASLNYMGLCVTDESNDQRNSTTYRNGYIEMSTSDGTIQYVLPTDNVNASESPWITLATQEAVEDAWNKADGAETRLDEMNTTISDLSDTVDTKANSEDVYTKSETYTQEEVDAAIEAAVSAAHTWGEF